MNAINIKTITAIVLAVLTISLFALFGTNSIAQKIFPVSDNIVLVKKIVYHDPELSVQRIHSLQQQCLKTKTALYETTKIASIAPKVEDNVSLDEIRKIQNVTITEYFSGNRYALYEVGQQFNFNKFQSKNKSQEEFDCGLNIQKYVRGEIRTPGKGIEYFKFENEQGTVYVNGVKAGVFERRLIPSLPKAKLDTISLDNTTHKCVKSFDNPKCFFKDMPIHINSKREIVLQNTQLEKGINKFLDDVNNMEVANLGAGFGDGTVYKAGDFATDQKFESIAVGKEISEIKFDMSMFKEYKVINRN